MIAAHNEQVKNIKEDELTRLIKRVAEIEWLLVVLVMLYLKLSPISFQNLPVVYGALCGFALFILLSRYSWLRKISNKWKITIDTWVMIVFITIILWHSGKIESPLLGLYLFVIITAAITLGEKTAFLEVGLISTICLFLSFNPVALVDLTLLKMSGPLIMMFPFWLTAYVTIRLANETKRAKEHIENLSYTDYLTGLYNMRMFRVLMEQEILRSSRFENKFAIMIIDADEFKAINDTFGHLAGDDMITLFAHTIRSTLRASDIVGRYGGDEFVALLPQTDASKALIAAERLRAAVAQISCAINGRNIQVTASIGIAEYPGQGTLINELLNNADKALLQSKEAGKNRITIMTSELFAGRLTACNSSPALCT
jgi:diguanylate cyclase (GGDEF)-like protein